MPKIKALISTYKHEGLGCWAVDVSLGRYNVYIPLMSISMKAKRFPKIKKHENMNTLILFVKRHTAFDVHVDSGDL